MIQLKKILILALIIVSTSMYAQTKDSLAVKHNLFKNLKLGFNDNDFIFNFNDINFSKNNTFFYEYNQTTKLNDRYSITDNSYIYNTSNLLLENNFRGQKIDSYNPYGASNIQSAVLLGIVGTLLNKKQN